MERWVFGIMLLAMSIAGCFMLIWPDGMAALETPEEDGPDPATSRRRMRVGGAFLLAGGIYMLYALLSGMRGGEFFPC